MLGGVCGGAWVGAAVVVVTARLAEVAEQPLRLTGAQPEVQARHGAQPLGQIQNEEDVARVAGGLGLVGWFRVRCTIEVVLRYILS